MPATPNRMGIICSEPDWHRPPSKPHLNRVLYNLFNGVTMRGILIISAEKKFIDSYQWYKKNIASKTTVYAGIFFLSNFISYHWYESINFCFLQIY